jgi:glucose/arabinose dehydrogenase
MRRSGLGLLLVSAAACSGKSGNAPHADAAPAPYCTATHGTNLKLTEIASNVQDPVFVTAPSGDPRIFIVERPGRVRVIGADGLLRDKAWLDISDKVQAGGEEGLLGLAFHPDFAKTGKIYVDYTRKGDGYEVLAEYTIDPTAETVQAQARILMVVVDPAGNHNGGMLQFGLDGFLYMSIGDGGGGGDIFRNGQNQQTLMAKILRVDPDHPAGDKEYGIPSDNPWANGPGVPEMYVWGLRNPWRFSIDSQTGDLYIGDVGQGKIEEVDVVPHGSSGQNFGWSVFEGTSCFGDATACDTTAPYSTPAVEYDRSTSGQCSVIGGWVYRGTCMPDLVGTYFYGDLCTGEIDTFVYTGGAATERQDRSEDLGSRALLANQLSSFGTDGYGELYVTALNAGKVYRVEAE